jgi:hypothetical protein
MGRKTEKAVQRTSYKESSKNVKHGYGGWSVSKKEEATPGQVIIVDEQARWLGDAMQKGVIKRLAKYRGFGFIRVNGVQNFFHTVMMSEMRHLTC